MAAKVSIAEQQAKLPLPATEKWPKGVWDISPLQHGYMSLTLFTPREHDYQTPHEQDELYIVYRGHGELVTQQETFTFIEGDVLFVQAGEEHRFERFTNDLILWVVFWGPKGGEP